MILKNILAVIGGTVVLIELSNLANYLTIRHKINRKEWRGY